MEIKAELLVIFLCFLVAFFYLRGFLWGIKLYQLNKSAYKKRKQSENFKDWLLYCKYKEELPKILRVLYYFVLLIHPLCAAICLLLHWIQHFAMAGQLLAKGIIAFDCVWMLTLALLFWKPTSGYDYERWITKKRGQKEKKPRR